VVIDLPIVRIVRDVFILACYAGLAYAEFSKLNCSHIQKRIDGNTGLLFNERSQKIDVSSLFFQMLRRL
jgi:hypothetical protein